MTSQPWVRRFDEINAARVGGKTASLGEPRTLFGDRMPDGFALTAEACRAAIAEAELKSELRRLLTDFDHHDVTTLGQPAIAARRPAAE